MSMSLCVMKTSHIVSDELRTILLAHALTMASVSAKQSIVYCEEMELEGTISTRYEYYLVGGVCGIFFLAELEWENEDIQIAFIIKEKTLKEGLDEEKFYGWYEDEEKNVDREWIENN